jgi:small subunit ribosomal protein S7
MRGKQAKKSAIKPDPKYNNMMVSRLINYMMQHGKKSVAQDIVYKAVDSLAGKTKLQQMEALEKALKCTAQIEPLPE